MRKGASHCLLKRLKGGMMRRKLWLLGICLFVPLGSEAKSVRTVQNAGRSLYDMTDAELRREVTEREREFRNLRQRALERNLVAPNVSRNDYADTREGWIAYACALDEAIDLLEDRLLLEGSVNEKSDH